MTLEENISKQIAAGFNQEEILDNMKGQPYTRQEILTACARMEAEVPRPGGNSVPWRTILSVVILIIALIRLIVRLSS